jgi:hypothetical protein
MAGLMLGTDEFIDVSDEAAEFGLRNTVFAEWSMGPAQLVLVAHTTKPEEVLDRVGRAM